MRGLKVLSLLSLMLFATGVTYYSPRMNGTYRLHYVVALHEGSNIEVTVNSGYMVLHPGIRPLEPVALPLTPRVRDRAVLYEMPSPNLVWWKAGHEQSGAMHTLVFRYRNELRPIGGYATALYFDVSYKASLKGGKKIVDRTATFAVPVTRDGVPSRCLRLEETSDGIAASMNADCTSRSLR